MKFPKIITKGKQIIEAVKAIWISEALLSDDTTEANNRKWRRLSDDKERDLTPYNHDRVQEISYFLYTANPLAHRIVEITKDFIIGDGCSYQADEQADEKVQQILDDFWNDSTNQFNLKQHQKALELGIFGEQYYPVFVNDIDGHVKLGYIDPSFVKCVITNPKNVEQPIEIKLKDTSENEGKTFKIIRENEDLKSDELGLLKGEVFYFAINKVSNATRGRSDLAPLIDWLDAYDQFLINRAERSALINAFVWDVTMTGKTDKELRNYMKQHSTPPRPGSVRFHNEKVKWESVTPSLNADDATKEARMLKNFILGGAGLPEHWFADGGEANRATAAEMSEPILKRLKTRQNYFKYMLEYMGQFVIDQAIIAGQLKTDANTDFTVKMSDLSARDTKTLSTSLKEVVMSTTLAVQAGVMSKERATTLILLVAEGFGDKIDIKEELNKIEEETRNTLKDAEQPREAIPEEN